MLVIPEDFRKDQYLLRPLFVRLFEDLGFTNVRVRVCQDPLLGGVREALKLERVKEIVEQYGAMTDMLVLCVDRDGVEGRSDQLSKLECQISADVSQHGARFVAENAWEEIETWALAGLKLRKGWRWDAVCREVQVKERYFEPLAQQLGVSDGPGGGRKTLGERAARNINAIRRKCPDFDALARRIEALKHSRVFFDNDSLDPAKSVQSRMQGTTR